MNRFSLVDHPPICASRRWCSLLLVVLLLSLTPLLGQGPAVASVADSSAPHGTLATADNLIYRSQTYLQAANASAFDYFASALAIDRDTLVVGAPSESSNGSGPEDNSAYGAGAAYVFVRSTAAQHAAGAPRWIQQAYLKASDTQARTWFGSSVAIDGDTIVVGASGWENTPASAGRAYVFVRSNGAWTQQTVLTSTNAKLNGYFGSSLAIAGDTIIVGASGEDSISTSPGGYSIARAGVAYVFERSNGAWTQRAYLKASNPGYQDYFGTEAAFDGTTILIGASWEGSNGSNPHDNSAPEAGAAYVFAQINGAWTQQAYLKAANATAHEYFGEAVAIDGDTLVIGAGGEDTDGLNPDDPGDDVGAAFVFERSNGAWTQQAYLKAANADPLDYFGRSVAIAGDTIVVGAPWERSDGSGPSNNSAAAAGAVYVFGRNATVAPSGWSQQAYLKAPDTQPGDWFGASVAIDDSTIAVGASSDGTESYSTHPENAGAAYVLDRGSRLFLPNIVRP